MEDPRSNCKGTVLAGTCTLFLFLFPSNSLILHQFMNILLRKNYLTFMEHLLSSCGHLFEWYIGIDEQKFLKLSLCVRPYPFFEIPQTCFGWAILFGANPVLYMIFVFMQMYYIFMHSRINIHKNKVRYCQSAFPWLFIWNAEISIKVAIHCYERLF